ncbi:hypothetical protein SAMN05444422_11328 [Halobiforma haloterrestris]|uniref:Uncharacterized protein n=1 Tax=Natronobacterium haloterrestre TaxID=148448 RepID=A0A1I1KVR5_NATHA|nr:hypothetical protein [Halobiforma haloterrestris]SFC64896.1 hypothetical protein SAMN05444422_11328 [Halobiforma haloterrestris]
MARQQPHTIRVSLDDRARVPFAIIGVLLLVSSVTVVGILESRDEAEVDADPMLALDRTEPLVQSELRRAALRATDDAARAPLGTTADTPVGNAIADPDGDEFERYLKLLIYAEAERTLPAAGQELRGSAETTVDLEPVDWNDRASVEAAIDRVELEYWNGNGDGDEDGNGNGPATGLLRTTIEDVSIRLESDDGNTRVRDRRAITVTVGTMLFELHERTERFERGLNDGFREADGYEGFSRKLAARLYPLVWGKAYYDRLDNDPSDRAFENVTPNEHTEVLANDAIFALQKDAFGNGAIDPYEDRVMRGAAACLAVDLGEEVVDADFEDMETLCESDYVFGDVEGELEDPPTIQELLTLVLEDYVRGEMEVELEIHPFAEAAFAETTAFGMSDLEEEFNETLVEKNKFSEKYLDSYYQSNIDNADKEKEIKNIADDLEKLMGRIDNHNEIHKSVSDVYNLNIETKERLSRENPLPDAALREGPIGSENHTYQGTEYLVFPGDGANVTFSGRKENTTDLKRDLVDVNIEFENTVQERAVWEGHGNTSNVTIDSDRKDITYTAEFTIAGEFAPDATVDRSRGMETALERGGAVGPIGVDNFDGAAMKSLEELFGTRSEDTLESRIESQSSTILSRDDFESAIDYDTEGELDLQADDIDTWLQNELSETHLTVVTEIEPLEVDLFEMVTGESPIYELESKVAELEDEVVYNGTDGSYENAPDMARAEVRQRYFENIYAWIETMGQIHDDSNDAADEMIGELLGGANDMLEDSVGFFQGLLANPEDVLGDDPHDEWALAGGSPLHEDVRLVVDGSPTYLPLETVEREEVPAVRPDGNGPLNPAPAAHAPLGAKYENEVGFPGAPVIPWPQFFFLQLDAWQVDVRGEYARFEVRATSGDGPRTDSTTYVREDKAVYIDATNADGEVKAGSVEPIAFENSVPVVTFVPSPQLLPRGSPGVGNLNSTGHVSENWNETGPSTKREVTS